MFRRPKDSWRTKTFSWKFTSSAFLRGFWPGSQQRPLASWFHSQLWLVHLNLTARWQHDPPNEIVIYTIFFTIGDFPIQFSVYTSCRIHHVFSAWGAWGWASDEVARGRPSSASYLHGTAHETKDFWKSTRNFVVCNLRFDAVSFQQLWLIKCRFMGERHIVSVSMPHNFRSFTCSSNI